MTLSHWSPTSAAVVHLCPPPPGLSSEPVKPADLHWNEKECQLSAFSRSKYSQLCQ